VRIDCSSIATAIPDFSQGGLHEFGKHLAILEVALEKTCRLNPTACPIRFLASFGGIFQPIVRNT